MIRERKREYSQKLDQAKKIYDLKEIHKNSSIGRYALSDKLDDDLPEKVR